MSCLVSGLTWNCSNHCFCYCFVVCVIPSLLQDLTTVYIFCFSFECHWRHFTVQRHLVKSLFITLFIPSHWNFLKFKEWFARENKPSYCSLFCWTSQKCDILCWVNVEMTKKGMIKKICIEWLCWNHCRDNKFVLHVRYSLNLGWWTLLKIPSKHFFKVFLLLHCEFPVIRKSQTL